MIIKQFYIYKRLLSRSKKKTIHDFLILKLENEDAPINLTPNVEEDELLFEN